MTKTVCLCLCLVLLFALASCGGLSQPSPPPPELTPSPEPTTPPPDTATSPPPSPSPTHGDSDSQSGEHDADGDPEIDGMDIPDLSGERNEALVAAFTPQNAEIITDTEETVIMRSKQSMTNLKAFYLAALDELGATQTALQDITEDYWVYSGVYDEKYMLIIELRDDGESVNIIIIY